jgi:hypothetical protein
MSNEYTLLSYPMNALANSLWEIIFLYLRGQHFNDFRKSTELRMLAFTWDGAPQFGAGGTSGDLPGPSAHSTTQRRRANGRHERLGFRTQLKALAPGMECFGRHAHDYLPLRRAEIACLSPSRGSISQMCQKCDRFQAFPGTFSRYLDE